MAKFLFQLPACHCGDGNCKNAIRHIAMTGRREVPVRAGPLHQLNDYQEPAAVSFPPSSGEAFWDGGRMGRRQGGTKLARRVVQLEGSWGQQQRMTLDPIPLPTPQSPKWLHSVLCQQLNSYRSIRAAGARHRVRERMFCYPEEMSGCIRGTDEPWDRQPS